MINEQENHFLDNLQNIQKRYRITYRFTQKDIHIILSTLRISQEKRYIGSEIKAWSLKHMVAAQSCDAAEMQFCVKKIITLYPLLHDNKLCIAISKFLGIVLRDSGNPVSALEYLFKAKYLTDSTNDNQASMIRALIATVLNETGNYITAVNYCLEAVRIYDKSCDPTALIIAYGTISLSYRLLKNYPMAIQYQRKVINLSKKEPNQNNLARSLSNLGHIYSELGDTTKAMYYFRKAIIIWDKANAEIYMDATIQGLGITYMDKGKYKQAIEILWKSFNIAQKYARKPMMIYSLISIANAHRKQLQYDEAISALNQALTIAEAGNYPRTKVGVYLGLSQINTDLENYKEALSLRKKAEELEEELRGIAILQSTRATEVAETLYRLEKEQKELEERARKAEEEAKHKEEQLQEVTASLQQSMKTLKEVEEVVKPFLEQEGTTTKELANSIYKSLSKAIKAQRSQKPEKYFDKSYQEYIRRLHKACEALTPMEIKVCILIKLNYSNKQIGEVMNVSELTVKTHRARIRKKMSLIPQENLLSVLLRI